MTQIFSPAKLKALRQERGLSRDQLAYAIRRNFYAIGAWERGRDIPNAHSIGRLCTALGCRVEDLYEDFAVADEPAQRMTTAKPRRARGASNPVDSSRGSAAPARSGK